MKIRSLEQFKRIYFPKSVKKEEEEMLKKDPKKWAEHQAKKSMRNFRKEVEKLINP